jgi:tetratricopeptide (TPR) repeat protein
MSPRLVILALSCALLAACASGGGQPPVADSAQPPIEPAPTEAEPPEPEEVPERAFPDDSLHALLVAEFALRRRDYQLALDTYVEQAPLLRDKAVSAHTTHLAQFMQREAEALEAVTLWVELEPDNVEANNTLATLLVRQGKTVEALPHMAFAQRQGAEVKFPVLLTGFGKLDPARQSQLVEGINELSLEFPDNTQLLLTQALINAEFQQFDAALAKLDRLLALQPTQEQALILEARILMTRGDKEPFNRLEQVLEDNPGDKALRLQYARLLTTSDMPAARQQFEILSAQSPRDGDLLLSLALINREIGDNLEAKAYLRQMLDLQQRVDEAHYYLGRVAEDDQDTMGALFNYKQVGEGRQFLAANSRIGTILINDGELDESHQWFDQVRQKHPQRSEQLYGLEVELLTRLGHPDVAMGILNAALQQFPDSSALRYARSMLGEQMDNLSLMESDLRAILQQDPDNATALNALGYTLADRTQRLDEAEQLITRALALQPDEPAILDSMGWVLFRQGKYEEALVYLKRAYAVFPDPEVAAHLGEAMWMAGDRDGATAVLRGAMLKTPDSEILLDTIERLGMDPATFAPFSAPRPDMSPAGNDA